MLFAVPTMYHRLADAAETDPAIAAGLGGARLLVSGSAPLPAAEHERLTRLTGQRVIERYGMSETLDDRLHHRHRASVVRALSASRSTESRSASATTSARSSNRGDDAIGEVHVRGPNVMLGYLNRPEATAAAFTARRLLPHRGSGGAKRGRLHPLVGRRATDLIKSGGFKIGAGEIESALLDHPAVAEAAVAGVARRRPRRASLCMGGAASRRRGDRPGADQSRGGHALAAQAPSQCVDGRLAASKRDGQSAQDRVAKPCPDPNRPIERELEASRDRLRAGRGRRLHRDPAADATAHGLPRRCAAVGGCDALYGNLETVIFDVRSFAGSAYPFASDWPMASPAGGGGRPGRDRLRPGRPGQQPRAGLGSRGHARVEPVARPGRNRARRSWRERRSGSRARPISRRPRAASGWCRARPPTARPARHHQPAVRRPPGRVSPACG